MTKPSEGNYQYIRPIATGGMGEVTLAYDPICKREIALKEIREDLKDRKILRQRFMREAQVTAYLSHPSIIPVYQIHENAYTMPYVQGKTLKELLREEQEIQPLVRIFSKACQAIAYAHSRGVLHRDLKPDNIIVGEYGEVYIFDWGLAKWGEELPIEEIEGDPKLTQPGKIFGTLAYMAPEIAIGQTATARSEIYSLGAILYQVLSLHVPFDRPSVKEMEKERWVTPAKRAPYRNVPTMLARIARKCLRRKAEQRYVSVEELLTDLDNYLEGRSEWFPIADLARERKEDWAHHENIHVSSPMALTQSLSEADWFSIMISKDTFPGNVALTTKIKLEEGSAGAGLLICAQAPTSGYCLWFDQKRISLYRNDQEVYSAEASVEIGKWHAVRIERVENRISVSIDEHLTFTYLSYVPLPGSQVGLIYRDDLFEMEKMEVWVGSYSIRINCLALPNAFLAEKLYKKAVVEYRRIALAFPDRNEGRQARFQAGIALLERAKETQRERDFNRALEEFEELHETAGAPLEYLGKALVYQAQDLYDEEAKCYELAYRRYRDHPLLPILEEHLFYRMHESARRDRKTTYRFFLLVNRQLPTLWESERMTYLIESLLRHWEELPFFTPSKQREAIAIPLAFWLGDVHQLAEIADSTPFVADAAYALLELGAIDLAPEVEELTPIFTTHRKTLSEAMKEPIKSDRVRRYLLQHGLDTLQTEKVLALATDDDDSYAIWAHLLDGNLDEAAKLFEKTPLEVINRERTILHFLYGCYLARTEGEELATIHFSGAFETPFPRTWALFGNPVVEKESWERQSFQWERKQLYRQKALYAHVMGREEEARHWRGK